MRGLAPMMKNIYTSWWHEGQPSKSPTNCQRHMIQRYLTRAQKTKKVSRGKLIGTWINRRENEQQEEGEWEL